ncbi:MAG: ATP-binding cassette domain-containing protein [Mediterraneibacter gnavus]
MALIKCDGISIAYEGQTVVRDLSFWIEQGDYLCIVGENGSGKSTLVKSLLGLKPPFKGQILLGDGLKQDEIGYLPQQTVVHFSEIFIRSADFRFRRTGSVFADCSLQQFLAFTILYCISTVIPLYVFCVQYIIQASLLIFCLYAAYLKILIGIPGKTGHIMNIFLYSLYIIFAVVDALSPVLGYSFYRDSSGAWHDNLYLKPFTIAYGIYMAFIFSCYFTIINAFQQVYSICS